MKPEWKDCHPVQTKSLSEIEADFTHSNSRMIVQIISGTVSLQLINNLQRHEVPKLYAVKSMQGPNMDSSDRESNFGIFIDIFNNYFTANEIYINKKGKKTKGTAVPLQAWSGPESSRKLRYPHFMTTAQDGGKVVSLTHRPPLLPGNTPGTHFC